MTGSIATLADLNASNHEFWRGQSVLSETRTTDMAVLAAAAAIIKSDIDGRVPIYFQKSFDKTLQDAAALKQHFLSHQARSGGQAEKTDSLQKLIEAAVRQKPDITPQELLSQFKNHQDIDPIQDIDEEHINFTAYGGMTKTAPISGLKHRLARARQKIKSR